MKYIHTNYNIIPENIKKIITKKHNKGYQIKKITDQSHPCFNQYGLFATKKWDPYEILDEYTGEMINIFTVNLNYKSDYLAGFLKNGFQGIGIDAQKYGNEMRFINHFQNIKKQPNVKFTDFISENNTHIIIICIQKINIGDEIIIDYGYNPQ